MAKEIVPSQTKRAEAFALWMKAPMPMITLFKTLDVTRLVKVSKKQGYKFNALLCWCIGNAAAKTEEFYILPVGDKLMQYDRLAVNIVVATKNGSISTCDIPFSDNFEQFYDNYQQLTKIVTDTGTAYNIDENYMVIGTSALAGFEIDGAVNIYAGIYNNPFLIWGKYRKKRFRFSLPISFQFHHTQMDGIPAAEFLERLQNTIDNFR